MIVVFLCFFQNFFYYLSDNSNEFSLPFTTGHFYCGKVCLHLLSFYSPILLYALGICGESHDNHMIYLREQLASVRSYSLSLSASVDTYLVW